MMSIRSLFHSHGKFCASHPLEVVVTTVTVIMSLMSMGGHVQLQHDKVCGWNYQCAKQQQLRGSDVVMVSIARCIALVYTYLQFRSMRRLGSKHLLGISGIFTIFSSFVFCIAFVKMFGNTLSGLHEALPFFLFLVDLSKASALAVFALSSTNREEIQENIGRGMELLGPSITLDTLVETLAIGLGTLSGVQQLEIMSSFGCLSFVANYVAFITFYPACLALVLEFSMDYRTSTSVVEYKQLAKEVMEEHKVKKPNPVIQRVKIIMCAGLAAVHIFKRCMASHLVDQTTNLTDKYDKYQQPEMPIWYFYLHRLFAVHVDNGLTLMLGVVLLVKYIFWDRHTDLLEFKRTVELHMSLSKVTMATQTDFPSLETRNGERRKDSATDVRTSFSIGDDDIDDDLPSTEARCTQTDSSFAGLSPLKRLPSLTKPRPLEECITLLKSENGAQELTDIEIKMMVEKRHIPAYKLEGMLGDYERGVSIRRQLLCDKLLTTDAIESLPFVGYDYSFVDGACCENVLGYTPVPVGVAGPLQLDNRSVMVPMATTEGCLVASTNRGCRAVSQGRGVRSSVVGDGMSRGPCVRFTSAIRASEVKAWLETPCNYQLIEESFNSTSRFARLSNLHVAQAGRLLYVRFVAKTGDAMGMNMLSKGTEKALHMVHELFDDMEILSLSGNYCTDKKPSAMNWIEGRGKSVVCEAIIPAAVVESTLKTSVKALVDLNIHKNLVGSAMAGSIGGYNAHAANVVAAVFIATGQDPAQTVASSNCITLMEVTGDNNEDLYISCTMPSIEVGTVGGGTVLPPQAACLKMLGVCGSNNSKPGENAQQLARVVCATVLAAELSLMSALVAGHLVRSHLRHNRSSIFSTSPNTSSTREDVPDGEAAQQKSSVTALSNAPHRSSLERHLKVTTGPICDLDRDGITTDRLCDLGRDGSSQSHCESVGASKVPSAMLNCDSVCDERRQQIQNISGENIKGNNLLSRDERRKSDKKDSRSKLGHCIKHVS